MGEGAVSCNTVENVDYYKSLPHPFPTAFECQLTNNWLTELVVPDQSVNFPLIVHSASLHRIQLLLWILILWFPDDTGGMAIEHSGRNIAVS